MCLGLQFHASNQTWIKFVFFFFKRGLEGKWVLLSKLPFWQNVFYWVATFFMYTLINKSGKATVNRKKFEKKKTISEKKK